MLKSLKDGDAFIVCEVSNRPLVLSTENGMFCGEDCECELRSREAPEARQVVSDLLRLLPPTVRR